MESIPPALTEGFGEDFWSFVDFLLDERGRADLTTQTGLMRVLGKTRPRLFDEVFWNPGKTELSPLSLALIQYFRERKKQINLALSLLRDEEEALATNRRLAITTNQYVTQTKDRHQSSAAVAALAKHVAHSVGRRVNSPVVTTVGSRFTLYRHPVFTITPRRLDGCFPTNHNPVAVWEVKEYWGKKPGGSKMSDAVYEAHLAGLAIREFNRRVKASQFVSHYVIVDGRFMWENRVSDLGRLIDLMNRRLISELLIGREIERRFAQLLKADYLRGREADSSR